MQANELTYTEEHDHVDAERTCSGEAFS